MADLNAPLVREVRRKVADVQEEVRHKAEAAEEQANQVDVPLTQRLGLVDFVKQVFREAGDDHLGAFAGNLAYQGLFAMFPFLIFLLSLLGIFHASSLVKTLMNRASATMPSDAVHFIGGRILTIAESHARGALTVSAIVAMLLALWGVSGAFRAAMEALNVMYGVKDERPFWKRCLISLLLALLNVLVFVAALVLIVFGHAIGRAIADAVGLGLVFQSAWNIAQWPVLASFLLLTLSLIYYFAPDVKQRFRFISPGAVTTVILWVSFSLLFSIYVDNFGAFNKVYGTLAGLAILLLFLYFSAFIVLLGAEVNQVIEEHAAGGKQEGERVPDTEARDTTLQAREHVSA